MTTADRRGLPIISATEIMARVIEAGGDHEILRCAGLDSAGAPLRSRQRTLHHPLLSAVHEHSRQRWEKRHDCLGCKDAARVYYTMRKRAQRA